MMKGTIFFLLHFGRSLIGFLNPKLYLRVQDFDIICELLLINNHAVNFTNEEC